MRASKTKFNKKKLFENYVAYLIKESDKRVLNERELLTLIAYTEDIGGLNQGIHWLGLNYGRPISSIAQRWFGKGTGLLQPGDIKSATYTPSATSNNTRKKDPTYNRKTKTTSADRADRQDFFNGTGNSTVQTRPNLLAKAGNAIDTAGDAALATAVFGINKALAAKDNLQKAGSAIRTGVKKTGDALRTGKELATSAWNSIPMQMARAGVNAAGRGIKAGSIWAWDKLKSSLDQSARDSAELSRLGYGKTTPPSQWHDAPGPALSESTIVKRGKRIKQKQIMSDFQEQMLIDYLNSRTKKLSKRKK